MKYFNKITYLHYLWPVFFVASLLVHSCKEEIAMPQNDDATPPNQVTDVSFEASNGGGLFRYTLPDDEDFMFVKAIYTLDSGEEIYKASSFYTDTLAIEGLGTEKAYDIKLVSVDRNGNESTPVVQQVTPLTPLAIHILKSLEIIPSFYGVIIRWENELQKPILLRSTYKVSGKEVTKVYSSNRETDNYIITGLDESEQSFKISIVDTYENETELTSYNGIVPMVDIELDKSPFSFLRDGLLPEEMTEFWTTIDSETEEIKDTTRTLTMAEKGGYDGGWNGKEVELEGKIQKFWDGIIDDGNKRNQNYFSTGHLGTLPFSYYIDMGRPIQISRVRVWQRDWDWSADAPGYYYTTENVETFELWTSNDLVNWTKLRRATIVEPSDPTEARNEGIAGHHFVIFEEEPRFSEPFRYLEYRGIKTFGDNSLGNASEITLYGKEAGE